MIPFVYPFGMMKEICKSFSWVFLWVWDKQSRQSQWVQSRLYQEFSNVSFLRIWLILLLSESIRPCIHTELHSYLCTDVQTLCLHKHTNTLIFISALLGLHWWIYRTQALAPRHAHYCNPYKKSKSLSHPKPESCHQVLSERLLCGDWSWSFGPGSRDLCCVVPPRAGTQLRLQWSSR